MDPQRRFLRKGDVAPAKCRCGCTYKVEADSECSHCPRCEKFNIHAQMPGWRKREGRR